jgi:hypothetical protein
MTARVTKSDFTYDSNGNVRGGHSSGPGLDVHWQEAPLGGAGERQGQTGAQVVDLIDVAIDRLEAFQGTAFASSYNEASLSHLRAARGAQDARTHDRERRGVEGTDQQ